MEEEKRNKINKILNWSKWLLILGVIVIILMPFILTSECFSSRFNFSTTGQIGDTIGGITAPFLNLIGAALVFFALNAQVKANELIQEQIERDNESKDCENEATNLNQLYSYLNDNINTFKFTSLPVDDLQNIEQIETTKEFIGGEAFYHLFSQINCHYHGSQEELHNNQAIAELYSVLKILETLLEKLETTKSKNKEILTTLVKHLFDYKIFTRMKSTPLDLEYCPTCECNHGLPDDLRFLIISIKEKLNNNTVYN
jgi:hypothetical protein